MNEVNDLMNMQDEYVIYMVNFPLWKPKWQQYSLKENFEWVTYSFIPCNQKKFRVPQAFTASLSIQLSPTILNDISAILANLKIYKEDLMTTLEKLAQLPRF